MCLKVAFFWQFSRRNRAKVGIVKLPSRAYLQIRTNQSDLGTATMRLSSMADYAVVTMSAAARHCGSARVSAA